MIDFGLSLGPSHCEIFGPVHQKSSKNFVKPQNFFLKRRAGPAIHVLNLAKNRED